MYWKSQWSGYNAMYYDPSTTYTPWPTFTNADPNTPKSHPKKTYTLNMDNTYYSYSTGGTGGVSIIIDEDNTNNTTGNTFTMTPSTSTIIIDDTDTSPKFTKSTAGSGLSWTKSTTAGYDNTYLITTYNNKNNSGTYTATWTPNTAGDYYVYARWVYLSTNSTSVPYKITYNSGGSTYTYNANQSINSEKWVQIYKTSTSDYYHFNGTTDNVTLSFTKASGSTLTAVADAVEFIPAGARWDWATSDDAEEGQYNYTAVKATAYTANMDPDDPDTGAGYYNVYAKWVSSSDTYTRATDVPYKITYSNTSGSTLTTTVTENQTQDSGQWVLLGTVLFQDTELPGNVSITYTPADLDHTVCADAVKFVSADQTPATINIRNSHYYVWSTSEAKPYLVVLNGATGAIEYYKVTDSTTTGTQTFVDKGEMVADNHPAGRCCNRQDLCPGKAEFRQLLLFLQETPAYGYGCHSPGDHQHVRRKLRSLFH